MIYIYYFYRLKQYKITNMMIAKSIILYCFI